MTFVEEEGLLAGQIKVRSSRRNLSKKNNSKILPVYVYGVAYQSKEYKGVVAVPLQ